MAKRAKKIQTDYTTGGHDISQTAIPLYQQNLTRMDNYLSDPTSTIDDYLNKYYSNTSAQSDFLRNYNRAMSGTTANNYAATSGGYSSSGQRAYDDVQRYMNDYASRLYDYGVSSAANMAQNYYNNLLSANPYYQQAYSLGKDYSDIEQYNNAVNQANKNWLSNITGAVGGVLSAFPATAGIGQGLGALSNLTSTDISGIVGGSNTTPSAYQTLGLALGNTGSRAYNWFKNNQNAQQQAFYDKVGYDPSKLQNISNLNPYNS